MCRTRPFVWPGTAAVVVALAILKLYTHYPPNLRPEDNSDAHWTYLPAARQWLENGWDFLLNDPFSTHVAPLGYLWPALWRADAFTTAIANGVLFTLAVLMMWHVGRKLGGWFGAMIPTLLLIYNQNITNGMLAVLTEPLYLFGLMLFNWSFIELLWRPQSAKWRWVVSGGIGLTITLLSRPVLQGMVVVGIVLIPLIICMPRLQAWRSCLRKILLLLLIGSVLPVAVAVKNGIQFDIWGIAVGSGAALYYGTSPLRLGHEPVYTGFSYDIVHVVRAADSTTAGALDRTSDQIGRAVSINLLKNTHPGDLLRFFGYKLRSWLLYSTPELHLYKSVRKLRLFGWLSIFCASMAWLWRRKKRDNSPEPSLQSDRLQVIVALLGIGVATMAAQLAPLLYNARYNAAFMEPWLLLLTAAAVGSLLPAWRTPHGWGWRSPRWRQLLVLPILAGLAYALTQWSTRHETLPIDPERMGPAALVLDANHMGPVVADTLAAGPQHWQLQNYIATLEIPLHADNAAPYPGMDFVDGVWRFHLRVSAAKPRRCRSATLKLEHHGDDPRWWPPSVLPIIADGQWRTYAFHGNGPLRPVHPGKLWLSFQCPPGTEISWGGAQLLRSTMPQAARAFWQQGVDINPYTPSPWTTPAK